VAIDTVGNVFVAVNGDQEILELSPSGLVERTIGTKESMMGGVAVDSGGNIYVGSERHPWVLKITPGGALSDIGTRLRSPFGVATDAAGDLFIADGGNRKIDEIPAQGGGQLIVQNEVDVTAIAAEMDPSSPPAATPEVPWLLLLPVLGGGIFAVSVWRQRRRSPSHATET
jgi:sugar lactone lactonase YvrE